MKLKWQWVSTVGLSATYILFWAGGVWSYAVRGAPPTGTEWAAPVYLALAAALALVSVPLREAMHLVFAGLLGFAAEVAGVHTGFPFGGYQYTSVLFPHVWGVPIVLFCAWIVVFTHARQIVRPVSCPWLRLLLTALWLVGLDLLIDPPAAGPLGYWAWEVAGTWHGIPWTNFAGWFFVGLLLAASAPHAAGPHPVSRAVGTSVVIFFTVIALVHRIWGAASAGVLLLLVDTALLMRASRRSRNPAAITMRATR